MTDATNIAGYDQLERLRQLERDLQSLSTLCREQQAHIRLLQGRIRSLQASRWRKLGQRLGLAMTLDWERRGT